MGAMRPWPARLMWSAQPVAQGSLTRAGPGPAEPVGWGACHPSAGCPALPEALEDCSRPAERSRTSPRLESVPHFRTAVLPHTGHNMTRRDLMLHTHRRYDYSNITTRSDYSWPTGTRLAVYVALNIEQF